MSAYTDVSDWCVRIAGSDTYRITKPLVWDVGMKGSGLSVTVRVGVIFDVSIPTPVRPLFSPHDPRYLKAAALHDDLLVRGWDRLTAAAIFQDAIRADGVGPMRRLAMWLAVSLWRFR
ncbi:DUF1353 domain-containing protein [Loktanella atrilutea]|uniref:DUF1353 domain-containing protein n=1 Tax=Loktanella atrilutea TaxID=366533 RepID=UPI0009341F29|nr:DUF1353 domain-containing protein [Loktanella atrilutea]